MNLGLACCLRRLQRAARPMAAAACLGACAIVPGPAAAPPTASGAGAGTAVAVAPMRAPADYEALARSGGRVLRFDPASSRIRVFAFRAGAAARAGHNHVLRVPRFTAQAWLPPQGLADARLDLEFRLDELELDRAADRAELGPAFASTLDEDDIARTRTHMLGPKNLQAEAFPLVHVQLLALAGEAPRLAARLQVELHGQRRDYWVAVEAEGLPQRLRLSGAFVLRQSDFGVQPYAALGGLLAVQDELVLEFRLEGA